MQIRLHDRFRGQCPLIGPAFYVWVQGCPRRCPGCCNLTAQNPNSPAQLIHVTDLAAEALTGPGGMVLTGGEPFLQARELIALCQLFHAERPDALILCYTGYWLEEIVKADTPEWFQLLKSVDVLIDGPYDQHRPADDPLLGSANQRIIILDHSVSVRRVLDPRPPVLQVSLDDQGSLRLMGTGGRNWSMDELIVQLTHHGVVLE